MCQIPFSKMFTPS